jgi:hypothetical protein
MCLCLGARWYSPGYGSALGPLALLECGGQLRTECALLDVCVPMSGAQWYLPGHGSALGPLALLECGGQLRTQCALLGVCACVWAHTGTRLVTAVPLGRWHDWNAVVSFAQNVRCLVCVCLCLAHTGTRLHGHGSALGPLALLECGGQLRTECALLGLCASVLAHTGTRLIMAVPLGR